jgi:hypothetical protein
MEAVEHQAAFALFSRKYTKKFTVKWSSFWNDADIFLIFCD